MNKIYNYSYFYNDNNEKIVEVKTPGTEQVAIALRLRYITGQGLRLDVSPITVRHYETYSMQSFIAFSNIAFYVDNYTRKSTKREQQAVEKIKNIQDDIANIFLFNDAETAKIKIFSLLNQK